MPTVGRNVPRRDGVDKVTGAAKYVDDLVFPGNAARADDPVDDRLRTHPRREPAVRPGGVHGRRLPRHPRAQRRGAHRRRSAVPGRARRAALRGADPAARARRSRAPDRGRRRCRVRAVRAGLRSRCTRPRSSSRSPSTRATSRPASAVADEIVEGEYRVGHQEHVYIETNGVDRRPRERRRHALRIAAVPVLRAEGALRRARPPAGEGARRAGRDGRRVRRQGGVPVDHRRARVPARAEGRTAGEDDLRPRRGHGGDDQAAPGDRPDTDRRDARRPADGDRRRRRARRRRLHHAQPGRAVAAASSTRPARTAATTSA